MASIASRRRLVVVLGIVAVVAAAAAALVRQGVDDADDQGVTAAEERRTADLAACLRHHGSDVDEDDITFGDDGGISLPRLDGEAAVDELRTAMDRCTQEPEWAPPPPTEDELERSLDGARAYVECLRPYGIELPEPVVIDGRIYFGDREQTELTNLDTTDPEVAQGLRACGPNA